MVVLGIGLDLVDVTRFGRVLARRPTVADRLFTARERHVDGSRSRQAQFLAARFAAKEAVMKALGVGVGAFRFTDVEVASLAGGAPAIELRSGALDIASARGVSRWLVTLTHTETTAAACAVALGAS